MSLTLFVSARPTWLFLLFRCSRNVKENSLFCFQNPIIQRAIPLRTEMAKPFLQAPARLWFGRRVGILRDSSSEKCITALNKQLGGQIQIQRYENTNSAARDLMKKKGALDFYMDDTPLAKGWKMRNRGAVKLIDFGEGDFTPDRTKYAGSKAMELLSIMMNRNYWKW